MSLEGRQLLALIPARGGSKGVPRKNLRLVGNKPLLSYTIEAAKQTDAIDAVYVSSDDPEILALSAENDAIAVRRADAASSDTATAADVMTDFISQLNPDLLRSDPVIVYLQPTSPLRNASHIREAIDVMRQQRKWQCMSVTEMQQTPFRAFRRDAQGCLLPLFEEKLAHANRQSLEPTYYPNGAIYIFPLSAFTEKGEFPSGGSVAYIMAPRESIDIDTPEDFKLLESLWAQELSG